jgi:hypothetical protein
MLDRPAIEYASGGHLETIEHLTLHEQYRLLEIAHATGDLDIKRAALRVLQAYQCPARVIAPSEDTTIT